MKSDLPHKHVVRLFAALIVTILSINSCKKDNARFQTNATQSTQLISPKKIASWLVDQKINQLMKLDWSKAKQAKIAGINVVRVPLLPPSSNSALTKSSLIGNSQSTIYPKRNNRISDGTQQSSNAPNYYPSHPPELYIAEVDNNLQWQIVKLYS